jgi:RNA polymerase sigma factor (sigma-70 family)
MMAMVLGTALTALGTAACGEAVASEATAQAVTNMSRYCTVCWRNARLPADSWSDCTQEVLRRLLERIEPERWSRTLLAEGDERREFLRAIDTVKKRAQRSRKWAPGDLDQTADERELATREVADERETVRQAAEELLGERQQRILQLSFEGWSVQDIAEEMSLAAERVSDEKYKAIRKLRAYLNRDAA